jgi:uncharacterized protein (TIGR01777 family)
MNVVITGGTGFVGSHLCRHLLAAGHRVAALGTRAEFDRQHSLLEYVRADTARAGQWQQHIAEADLIFNLAGKSIFHRWSKRSKNAMTASRIETTRNLVAALPASSRAVLVSTSAAGYYGNRRDELLTEDAAPGDDFLARLSREWEEQALRATDKGARVVTARFGIVLGTTGGALGAMLPAFRWFVGGPLGDGTQWFPWIHVDDLIAALDFLARENDLQGPFNLCAPNPVRNADLARILGRVLKRPAKLAMPAMALKMLMGELASVLLASQRVVPQKLLDCGFKFQYPKLEDALRNLLG